MKYFGQRMMVWDPWRWNACGLEDVSVEGLHHFQICCMVGFGEPSLAQVSVGCWGWPL